MRGPAVETSAGKDGLMLEHDERPWGSYTVLEDSAETMFARHAGQIEVHLARRVREDAQLQELGGQAVRQGIGVIGLRTDEHQQTRADFAHARASDRHVGSGHALNQRDHFMELAVTV